MNSVLTKTMQSLETALRYNPQSLELMTSLAEVYVRLGRFDNKAMELCESVLAQNSGNSLIESAQSIGILIEQARELESSIQNSTAPSHEVLVSSIAILDEFLLQSPECLDAWQAWVRLNLLDRNLRQAAHGFRRLRELGAAGLQEQMKNTLAYACDPAKLTGEQWSDLARLHQTLGDPKKALTVLEEAFDEGLTQVGPTLLKFYLQKYDAARAGEVPLEVRSRLMVLLLDHATAEVTGQWLRQATLLGWEVTHYSKDYARVLIEQNDLDDAFAVLQRMVMDAAVKDLLNVISEKFESRDDLDKAVAVLRYINDHQLVESDLHAQRESQLVREAELSMAELQMKSGRPQDALAKYISALCLSPQTDPALLYTIDELLEQTLPRDAEPLLRLGMYFRQQKDFPKAISYLNLAQSMNPYDQEVMDERESLFTEILHTNPDLPQLRLELGELYLTSGRPEAAAPQLQLAAGSPAQFQEATRHLARAFFQLGRHMDALEKYRALALVDDDLPLLYEIHLALVERDQCREALHALNLISRVNPQFPDLNEKIRLLEDRVGKLAPETGSDPKMRELIGDLAVGRYEYMERLGSGGMGVVHKVRDIRNQQVVAMKILRDSLSGSNKALDRFFREARIAATLSHPNIVNIHDYNISNLNGQSYIVMEYVDGPSLREIIDRQFQNNVVTNLDYIAESLFYFVQLCDALQAAHDKGIVHRDIKPDNIMINSEGAVKITDFGIVHIEEATFTPTGAMLGTPRYMSPEQVTGGQIDGRSDLYSVGILMYETLAGSPPFMTGDISYQQVHNNPISPREINPVIPQACEEIILRCMEKAPDKRWRNALHLKQSLAIQLDSLGGCNKYACLTVNRTEVAGITDSPHPTLLGLEDELDL